MDSTDGEFIPLTVEVDESMPSTASYGKGSENELHALAMDPQPPLQAISLVEDALLVGKSHKNKNANETRVRKKRAIKDAKKKTIKRQVGPSNNVPNSETHPKEDVKGSKIQLEHKNASEPKAKAMQRGKRDKAVSTPKPKKSHSAQRSDQNHLEYGLPYGWKKLLTRRLSGASAGNWDTYLISPLGKRLRSNVELTNYLKSNPDVKCDLELTKVQRQPPDTDICSMKGRLSPAKKKLPAAPAKKKPKNGDRKVVPKTRRPQYPCDFEIAAGKSCPVTFKEKEALFAHKLTHVQGPALFQCNNCFEKFYEVSRLSSHVKFCGRKAQVADSNMNTEIFSCHECNHPSQSKNDAVLHLQQSHWQKPECSKCSKKHKLIISARKCCASSD